MRRPAPPPEEMRVNGETVLDAPLAFLDELDKLPEIPDAVHERAAPTEELLGELLDLTDPDDQACVCLSDPPSTPATEPVSSGSAKPRKKGSRPHRMDATAIRRQQIEHLRSQVEELEGELSRLQQCVVPTTMITPWEEIAKRQRDAKKRVEAENARLRAVYQGQLKVVRGLMTMLHKGQDDMISEWGSINRSRITETFESSEAIFRTIRDSLGARPNNTVDEWMQESGLAYLSDRFDDAQFAELKETFPYGQLPLLEVDGEVIAESEAVLRYAGRLSGLYPVNDPVAALKIDELLGSISEMTSKIAPSLREQDADKRKTLREEAANVIIPRYIGLIDHRLTQLKEYAVFKTDTLFIHELLINNFVSWMKMGVVDHIPTTVCDGYPAVEALVAKVSNHPKVVEYYANPRNVTPKLKLTYPDGSDHAEAIRLAFLIGGVEFEDERVQLSDMEKLRPSLPFGQLPVLSINDEPHAYSTHILRYAGTRAGLYSTTDMKHALRVDEVLSVFDDYYNALALTNPMEPEAQLVARKNLAEGIFPKMFNGLDKRIAGWGGNYAVGDELTIADIAIYSALHGFKGGKISGIPASLADGYLHIGRVYEQVFNLPKTDLTLQDFDDRRRDDLVTLSVG
ncbi:hypothetical protein Poli38472_004839 [Pythium oligandrum]|uniref:Glutathione S-transferase n=1 Tax=Pythium oligandrum TaxID=41045 RepID=A0A8K1CAY5_PYTOL|nr:hypothetical protein Poli38472_004839 [Pythium oligandrum]|eukprot:TMW59770.1 hypothetical protein Poli38472_004839 [Pythium oligandrum]